MRKFFTSRIGIKYFVLSLLFIPELVTAQDDHFSQFSYTPLQVNPAMTGVFDGIVRVSNSFRTQWSGLGNGYKTLHLSVDAPVGKATLKRSFFGVGAMVYQDWAGTAGFKTTVIEGSLSYTAAIDDQLENYFSMGFQAGLNQNSFDITKATWDSQWNGDAFDPTLSSRESVQLPQATYVDLNAGLLYYYVPDGITTFDIGASLSHIGSPNVSFFLQTETPLRQKITLHSSAEIPVNEEGSAWILPKAMVIMQGNQKDITVGGFFKNKVQFKSKYTNYKKEAYFYGGAYYRYQDAFILAARFEFNTVGLGLSYDINTSSLSNLAGSANAFEVNFSYISYIKRGTRSKNYNKMPRYF